jgi:hypothetical protein
MTDALLAMLPDSVVIHRCEFDWHSATFSGKRLVLDLQTQATLEAIDAFAQMLGEHEFSVPAMLVADIIMTKRARNEISVEALLLDDER